MVIGVGLHLPSLRLVTGYDLGTVTRPFKSPFDTKILWGALVCRGNIDEDPFSTMVLSFPL